MRFVTTWLIILFVSVASGNSTSSAETSITKVEGPTESTLLGPTIEKSTTDNGNLKTTLSEKLRNHDDNDLATDKDVTLEDLLLTETLIDGKSKIIEDKNNGKSINADDADNVNNNPETPIESKINKDIIDIRRQETNSETRQENSNPAVQFDDSKTERTTTAPQRFGQRSRKFRQKIQDSVPLLQLTQGGYERPYKRPRIRGRYLPRPDSSEQSENVQQPGEMSSNSRPSTGRIVPQVTYSPSPQPPYTYGQGLFVDPAFESSARNMLAMNQILPPPAQNRFLNSPPAEFTGYSNNGFQPQFSPNNEVRSIPNFSRDINNAGVYQTLANNPFQTPGILFQNSPQIQPQPILIDAGRNVHSQFQQNSLPAYSGYETIEGSSTPNYDSFFSNSAINTPFQVPPNFYGSDPNTVNPFNNPPISFLSQYPNFENGVPPQFYRYPYIAGEQTNQQSSNNQQVDPDASQNEDRAKVVEKNMDKPVNRDDTLPARFGTGLQTQNIANVYMRYPTIEAGYAIEENLPAQNSSEETKDDSKEPKEEQTNNPNPDPYKNILNSVRGNQRINNSFDFPPELFRSAPIDFGYQIPQGRIFTQYPDRNRAPPNYPSRNFESRIPFNPIPSLTGNFLGVNNQQQAHPESNETPSCAKENNASVCFQDNDYPKNEILYTLNSNSFLTDRLLNSEPSLNSFDFVERNTNETEINEENYACEVATKYGMPLRSKNLAGTWRIIINLQGRFSQPVRMEVCKTFGSSCSYTDARIKTACVQKYSLQRLLTWSPRRGLYSDLFKIPVACSCQIVATVET